MKTLSYFMAVLCIFSLVGIGSAAQIEVGEDTNIAAAMSLAKSGDTVHIQAGTYSIAKSIFVPAGVEVYGDGVGNTVIYTDSDKDINSASNPAMFVVQENNVVIHDLTFRGPATSLKAQHAAGGTSRIGGLREARNGISVTGASNVTIYNCDYTMLLSDGIRISSAEGVNIYNCTFDCAGHDSISVFKSENVKMSNCKYNMMINTCVRLYNSKKCSITNSTFTQGIPGTGAGFIELEGSIKDVAINHNIFRDSSDPAIFTANAARGNAVVNDNVLYNIEGLRTSYGPYDVTLVDNEVYRQEQNWTAQGYGYNGGSFLQMTPYVDDGIDMLENVTDENVTEAVVEETVEPEIAEVIAAPVNCTENCTTLCTDNCTVTNETTVIETNVSSVVIQFFDALTAKYFDFSSENAQTASVLANESANDLQQAKVLMNNTTEEEKQLGQKYLEASELKLQYAQDLLNLSREGLDDAKARMNVSCEGGEC